MPDRPHTLRLAGARKRAAASRFGEAAAAEAGAQAAIDGADRRLDPDEVKGYEPLAAFVGRSIREAILDGRLKPGDRIRQEDIARRLGTSRIPVREALRTLETEGLVSLVPHSGARVAVMDYEGFSELYRLREVVEPMAIGESASRLSDAQIAHLQELMSIVEQTADDPLRWLQADRQFHLESYSAAPLPKVLAMIEGFWNQSQQYRRAYLYTVQSHMEIVNAEHRLILEALERRDPQDAANLQRLHIRRTRTTLAPH